MPMSEKQAEVWNLWRGGNGTLTPAEISKQTGDTPKAVKSLLDRAKKWADASEGQAAAMEATGLEPDSAKFGWRIIQHDDGSRDSVFWDARGQAKEDTIEVIREAVEGIPAVKPKAPPKHSDSDLLTLLPVADLHAGMMAWGEETGEDYDTKKSMARLEGWVSDCVTRSPKSGRGVILLNGDTLHANDRTNATPQSKHVLDVDTRPFKTIHSLINSLGVSVEVALSWFDHVDVVVRPGNHDRDAYLAILFAMAERYRNEPRVTVDMNPSDFWAIQFGRVMLASHHGDKGKAQRMVLFLADAFPEMWGKTRYRFLWTGHLHHHKSEEIGGMVWEQSRAMAPKDSYAASHSFGSLAELQAITYHRERGEVSRVKVTA